jgi:biofilm PGA synthesis protein PgaA
MKRAKSPRILAKAQKPRVELKGLPIGNPNDEWMDAQQLAAQAGTYGGDLPHGEERLQTLVDQARATSACAWRRPIYRPGNGRRAENQLKETESMVPRDMGLELAQARTAMTCRNGGKWMR